ncbi:Glycoside hydrolase family 3 C-terminal domain [Macleaya cordata]|uniref:Glycoside hydrolase family 3 C-terminal domain n=1 Tax=Macleaya cordata TaxID=56857 RepID=A0A200R4M5_MACCD|nr:Glycoside hydrolase family 3 C-terminal domain [Macleaya cordata]
MTLKESSYEELERIHRRPYLDCLAQGVSTIWEGIDTLCEPYRADFRYCVSASINAGIDMECVEMYMKLIYWELSMARIDDEVEQILRVKFIAGLFEYPFTDRSLLDTVGCKEHRELAREAVRKSLVLLKNGKDSKKPLLPLDKNARRILVAGQHANDLGYYENMLLRVLFFFFLYLFLRTTILEAIREAVGEKTEVIYEKNPTLETLEGQKVSFAVAVVGEPAYAESRGYNTKPELPLNGVEIVNLVADRVPTLVILITGRLLEPEFLEKIGTWLLLGCRAYRSCFWRLQV